MGGGEDNANPLVKVRAVTSFIVMTKDQTQWKTIISNAIKLNADCARRVTAAGYVVQTLRIVTNPFGEYLDTTSEATALAGMAAVKAILEDPDMPKIRVRFAIGAAQTVAEIAIVPALIQKYADIANACVNVGCDEYGVPDMGLIVHAAHAVSKIATTTPRGEGNFNWTVNFNCKPDIPYFPAGYNTTANGTCFALGFEHPDLMVDILKRLVPEGHTSIVTDPSQRAKAWATAYDQMQAAFEHHTKAVADIARAVSSEYSVPFVGIDSSAAPSKNAPSLAEVVRLLGVTEFGAAGTVQVAAFLTKLFKSIKSAPCIGFSGFMLAPLEDAGLAQCAIDGTYDIRALLTYSAVCGIGLDCVCVPGDTTIDQMCQLMGDVGTMAFRLNKPLTCRLFVCPGLKAGDVTDFQSTDLCNCSVFAIPGI